MEEREPVLSGVSGGDSQSAQKPLVSIVCPCYNEEAMLPLYFDTMQTVVFSNLTEYDFELLLINDGSKDRTLPILRELAQKDTRVKYISFSRNFGKEAAMYAGLKHAKGEFVCVMDCDLQDPPEMIATMLERLSADECDCVATRRVTRKGEPRIRSAFARAFYRIINRISDTEFVDGARDFRMMRRCVVDAVLELPEYHRFSKGIFMWVGFDTVWLEYENIERAAGETKWSFWKLMRYAIEGIVSFSTAPLQLATAVGSVISVISLLYMIVRVIIAMIWGNPVAGYPSLLAIMLTLGGFVLLALGIIGEYVARTYMQVKQRPIYIQKETNIKK
ncbi:MAG: glycosyltransferase family 2 protein [Eubacteriales bacterium]|nr:glycosyltransferase family 2 protein [Eubacteriales bacterium]